MNLTNKEIIVCIGNLEFEAPVYADEEGYEYAKINKLFFSIDTLNYLGYKITAKSPG